MVNNQWSKKKISCSPKIAMIGLVSEAYVLFE